MIEVTIRWGILGAANIAFEQVVPAIRRSSNSEVVAIASYSKYKVDRFNINRVYDTYDDLLNDEAIDAVYIPLPNELHAKYAIKALKSGKHVLVEKPITASMEQLRELLTVQKESHKVVLEAFMYQYHQQHKKVQQILESDYIGSIKHVKAHFSWQIESAEDIRLNKSLAGGALYDVGCYCMHAITQIVGFKPVKIQYLQTEGEQVDLTGVCTMINADQQLASFVCSMNMPFYDMYEVIGTKGSIRVEHSFRPDLAPDGKGRITLFDENRDIVEQHEIEDDQYLRQIEHFETCIVHPEQVHKQLEASLQTITYIEKAYASLSMQKPIRTEGEIY